MTLIIVNAIILGLETNKTAMASYGRLLEILDHFILAVFVIEIAARIVVHRWAFFRDPWSVFDFIVVGIALVPATETFSVLRALRVLRVLRLDHRRADAQARGRRPARVAARHGLDRIPDRRSSTTCSR